MEATATSSASTNATAGTHTSQGSACHCSSTAGRSRATRRMMSAVRSAGGVTPGYRHSASSTMRRRSAAARQAAHTWRCCSTAWASSDACSPLPATRSAT